MEGKPELTPLEPNTNIEREASYSLELRFELVREVYARLVGAINTNYPVNTAEENIDNTLLTRQKRAKLVALSNKFILPPNVLPKPPYTGHMLPVSLSKSERKLIQEVIESRYGASPAENIAMEELLNELNEKFYRAEVSKKLQITANKIKDKVSSFSSRSK